METEFYPNFARKPHEIPMDDRAIEIVEEFMEEYNFSFAKAVNLLIINLAPLLKLFLRKKKLDI